MTDPRLRLALSRDEVMILTSLVEQVAGLLEGDATAPAADDPFALWQAELAPPVELDRDDPVIARLFPDAYPDDEHASDEFRRLTQARQRQTRLTNAGAVLAGLRASRGGTTRVSIPLADLPAWLTTLTSVRLSLAVRLEIDTDADRERVEALPRSDPRWFTYRVYEWLAHVQERLLQQAARHRAGPAGNGQPA